MHRPCSRQKPTMNSELQVSHLFYSDGSFGNLLKDTIHASSSDEVRAECDPSQLGVSSMPATSECGPRDGNPPAGKQTTRNSSDDNASTILGFHF